MKQFKTNIYNVFEVRQVDFPPVNLEYASIPLSYNMVSAIKKWIEYNLKSRYYIGKSVTLTSENTITNSLKIGFEESKELSYFMLACPYLKYNS